MRLTNSPVIQLKAVSKQYDDITAVDNVSISVIEGDLLVLLGSSGCGKTTTLRLVAGLERPNLGEIWLDGRQVAGNQAWIPPEERHVGMVFQDYALFPHLTVAQNIEFALKGMPKVQRNDRIYQMLEIVGLVGTEKRYPHQLSGGQQQRIALARALSQEPSVVLLDEPFSNLDAALRKFMREEVRRILRQAGATAIFVTHDQEEAMSLADVVAVMRGGKVLQTGSPDELYRFPRMREVATFLGESNLIPGQAYQDRVETELGILPLARAAQGQVEVMIRPEALTLASDIDGPGIVTDVRFYGHYKLVHVGLESGTRLETRTWAQSEFRIGDQVAISVQGEVVAFDAVPSPQIQ